MRYRVFGESHGESIGVVLDQVPAGLVVDMDAIRHALARRAPSDPTLSTTRREPDVVRLVSGVFEGKTTGAPLCALIDNVNTRSGDYAATRWLARPGHADYTGHLRFSGHNDPRGGGHFSGRLTAPLVVAGVFAKQILHAMGVNVYAHIQEVAGVCDAVFDSAQPDQEALRAVAERSFPVLDERRGEGMQAAIRQAKGRGDSVGGIVACVILGLPAGLGGSDVDDTLEGLLARHWFGIPAVKGVAFGAGFGFASMTGSVANDPLYTDDQGQVRTRTNHNGGINGGISNGMPLVASLAIKPTPSIALEQDTIDMRTGESARLQIVGRHDPCIVHRVVPVVEAVTALALTELTECAQTACQPAFWPACGQDSQ